MIDEGWDAGRLDWVTAGLRIGKLVDWQIG